MTSPYFLVPAIWLIISIILAPLIGGFLRRNRRSYPKYPPLPSGSIRDRDQVHGGERARMGRAHPAVEHRHLAEQRARTEHRDDRLPAVAGFGRDGRVSALLFQVG